MSQDITGPTGQNLQPFNFDADMLACSKILKSHAFKLTRNATQSEDLVQETFLKALANRDKFTPGTSMSAWLHTILRNTFLSLYRKRGREVEGDDVFWHYIDSARPQEQTLDERMDLEQALEALPEGAKTTLYQIAYNGLSYDEMAEMGQVAVGTIKSRVNRARYRLQKLLGHEYAAHFNGASRPKTLRLAGKPRALTPPALKEALMLTLSRDGAQTPSPLAMSDPAEQRQAVQRLATLADKNRKVFNQVVLLKLKEAGLNPKSAGLAMLEEGCINKLASIYNLLQGKSNWDERRVRVLLSTVGASAVDVLKGMEVYLADVKTEAKASIPPAPPPVAPEPPPVEVAKPALERAEPVAPVAVPEPLPVAPPATLPVTPASPPVAVTKPPEETAPKVQPTTTEAMAALVRRLLKERMDALDDTAKVQMLGDLIHRLTR